MAKADVLAVLVALLLLLTPPPALATGPSEAEVFDGGPCLELLIGMLSSIVTGDYGRFNWSLWWFAQAEPPEEVAYLHNRIAELLEKLAHLLRLYEDKRAEVQGLVHQGRCAEAEERLREAEELFLEAYRAKVRLVDEGRLDRYARAILGYVNAGERPVLERRFERALSSLVDYIEAQSAEIARLESEVARCSTGRSLGITIRVTPPVVDAGGVVTVSGRLTEAPGHGAGLFKVLLRVGGVVLSEAEAPGTRRFNVSLAVPGVENLPLLAGAGRTRRVRARVDVVYASDGKVLAYNSTMLEIAVYRPNIRFKCPLTVRYNESIVIPVMARIDYPLNLTVYLDGRSVYNGTVGPATSELVLGPGANFTLGYHTLAFEVKGRGKYVTASYSCALAIVVEQPSLDVVVDLLSLYPFSGVRVLGKVVFPRPANYTVEILLEGGGEVDVRCLGTEQPLNLTLFPSPPLIIGFRSVRIRVYDPALGTVFEYSHPVVVVNTLGLLGALLLILLALANPPGRDIVELPTLFAGRLRGLLGREARGEGRGVRRVAAGIAFRPSRLARLYHSILRRVAARVGGIEPSETLREYLLRAGRRLEDRVFSLFRRLTLIFEKDLYSRHGASDEEVREARRIGEVLEHEA